MQLKTHPQEASGLQYLYPPRHTIPQEINCGHNPASQQNLYFPDPSNLYLCNIITGCCEAYSLYLLVGLCYASVSWGLGPMCQC